MLLLRLLSLFGWEAFYKSTTCNIQLAILGSFSSVDGAPGAWAAWTWGRTWQRYGAHTLKVTLVGMLAIMSDQEDSVDDGDIIIIIMIMLMLAMTSHPWQPGWNVVALVRRPKIVWRETSAPSITVKFSWIFFQCYLEYLVCSMPCNLSQLTLWF